MPGEDKQTGQGALSEELERTRTGREQQSRPDGQARGPLPQPHAGEDQVRVELAEGEQTSGGGAHSDKAGHDHRFNTDPGHWSHSVNEQLHARIEKLTSPQDKHQRLFFPRMYFKHKLGNGEHLPRERQCYSPLEASVFSLACKVFGRNNEKSPFGSVSYSNWKHASERIADHKSSEIHRKAMIVYNNQAADSRTMNSELIKTV